MPHRTATGLLALALILCVSLPAAAEDGTPGFAVDVFPASDDYPRNSEGSVIELADGRFLLATTRFYGGRRDASAAHIAARTSDDAGRTWSEPRILQKNVGHENVMSVTLRRLAAPETADGETRRGAIGMFYLVKNGPQDLKVHLRISDDEAKSFSEPIVVTDRPGYHVMNNDRVVRLSSGRLLCPVAFTQDARKTRTDRDYAVRSLCFISDDGGRTWRAGEGSIGAPKRGAMEPEVIEKQNGDLLMLVRTQLGRNLAAISKDRGETWSEPEPFGPPAPEAPSTLRRIPSTGDWLLIFNDNVNLDHHHSGRRTPLTAAVSTDEGETWTHKRNIEARDDRTYAYTSLIFRNERALMSYWVRNGERFTLRFRSVPVGWFYGE